jgi:hypothetical protein
MTTKNETPPAPAAVPEPRTDLVGIERLIDAFGDVCAEHDPSLAQGQRSTLLAAVRGLVEEVRDQQRHLLDCHAAAAEALGGVSEGESLTDWIREINRRRLTVVEERDYYRHLADEASRTEANCRDALDDFGPHHTGVSLPESIALLRTRLCQVRAEIEAKGGWREKLAAALASPPQPESAADALTAEAQRLGMYRDDGQGFRAPEHPDTCRCEACRALWGA